MLPDLVSVVIPAFNQGRYLSLAIASARAQSIATEIIVVDDGSTDETPALATRAPDVVWIRQSNRGVQAARNTGLAAARGELVVFLDADDVLLDGGLEAGVTRLRAAPDALFAAGRCRMIDAEGRTLPTTYRPVVERDHYAALFSSNYVWAPGCAVFRTSAVVEARGFDSAHAASADYALYLHLARRGSVICHDRQVVAYRRHDAAMSRDPVGMLESTLHVLDDEAPHVPAALRPALERGRRAWRDYYGEMIVNVIRDAWRSRQWARFVSGLVALARLNPRALLVHAKRKTTRTVGLFSG